MGITGMRRGALSSILLLALAGFLGCSTAQPTGLGAAGQHPEGQILMIDGLLPPWDLTDMVKQSDAIVVGTLQDELGTRTSPGGSSDPPRFSYEFTDYKIEVTKVLHPKDGISSSIAVMAETGVVSAEENVQVLSNDDVPEYAVGEEVILFLRSLADEKNFDDDIARPAPYGVDDYFSVMVGQDYGKMEKAGDGWQDSRSGKGLTVEQIREVVEKINSD